jgi:hypothetical protein
MQLYMTKKAVELAQNLKLILPNLKNLQIETMAGNKA